MTMVLGVAVDLRDVQIAALTHADAKDQDALRPRLQNLDRHPKYIFAAASPMARSPRTLQGATADGHDINHCRRRRASTSKGVISLNCR